MKKKSQTRLVFGLFVTLSMVIVALVAYIAYLQFAPDGEDVPAYLLDDDGITELSPPVELGAVVLTDQTGGQTDISALDGDYTLVTFGFTHCPDVCPITLGEMRKIHDELGNDADQINFVFVSVDGARDTPPILKTYLETLRVDDFVIGLTGDDSETAILREPLGVEVIRHEPDALGNYSVDHTAGMFLLDADNNWIRRYRYTTLSDAIADDILNEIRD